MLRDGDDCGGELLSGRGLDSGGDGGVTVLWKVFASNTFG